MTTTPESGVIVDDESRVVPRCSSRSVVVVLSISITDDKGQLIAAGNGDIVNGSYWDSAAIIVLTAHTTFSLLHHTG